MKRLMDETTDELVRSLLAAGVEHRPPTGNKARVIVALGAGGAAGLFSSNAFAWLSTTAGKVAAVGVAVGVAGAVWVAVPSAQQVRSGHAARPIATPSTTALPPEAEAAEAVGESASARASQAGHDVVGSGAENGGREADREATGERARALAGDDSGEGVRLADARGASADARDSDPTASAAATRDADQRAATSARRERGARKASKKAQSDAAGAKEKLVASKPRELRRDGRQSLAETLPAGRALDWSATEQAALDAAALDAAALDAEVKLVDDMHWAARRNDRAALGRFVEQYRATFPEGQLKNEVAEFAARVDRPAPSGAR